ncbi:Transcriptional regulator, AraC family protein [Minicystis rosea]|nr:Transcriptional regulator, AraC family protein [Minicystis rosea]
MLLRLAQCTDAAGARPAHTPDAAVRALHPAAPLRAEVARIARDGGLGAVFAIGDGLDTLTFSPTLYLLESSAEVALLARRWCRLERAWGIQHLTRFELEGTRALRLDASPYRGALAPLSQNVMICGVVAALLRRLGRDQLVASARDERGRWIDLVADTRWVGQPAFTTGSHASFRLAWSREAPPQPARLALHRAVASADDDPIAAVLAAIERDAQTRWTPARLAHATRQSVRTLHRRLATHGTSPGALVRRVRMRAACIAIATSSRPLTDIAHEHGFSDAAHLTREIRAAAGMVPSHYRAAARDE